MIYKKQYFILMIILSISSFSQEIDKSYLDSLPKDIRNDLMEKMQDNDNDEDPVYRSKDVSTRIQKIQSTIQ